METKENKSDTKQQIIQYLQKENEKLKIENNQLKEENAYLRQDYDNNTNQLKILLEHTEKAKADFLQATKDLREAKKKTDELYVKLKESSVGYKRQINKFFKKNKIK